MELSDWEKASSSAGPQASTLWMGPPTGGCTLEEIRERLESGRTDQPILKEDLPTPALLLDLDLFERNLHTMSTALESSSLALRPHAKTHKCVEVARHQIAAGALGISTATLREAEAMAAGGIGGLLITSELVGYNKLSRLVRLTRQQPDTLSVVDSAAQATQLEEAAAAAKVTFNLLIDVDPGGRRTGTQPGTAALRLAQAIMKLPHLALRGIHSYSGASSHVVGFEARQRHSFESMAPSLDTFAQMQKAGMPVEILSGGSTGTYNIDTELEDMTELQAGSYVFMDVDYRLIGGENGPVYDDFAPALTVLATVISKNYDDIATIDAGFKSFATDRTFGSEPKDVAGVRYEFFGDEHGKLVLENPSREIRLGDRLEFIVSHCDPTVNLYDSIYCVRGERVDAMWPVDGRGQG